ncbi:hypothetical protein [Coxiella-like endosymbiont]|nr:hypothetical protein [Coxiella-like endosymbiont]
MPILYYEPNEPIFLGSLDLNDVGAQSLSHLGATMNLINRGDHITP